VKFKTTILCTLLLFSTTAYASDSNFDGPFVGFNANYEKTTADTTYEAFGGAYDYKIKTDGTSFGLFGGWNKTFPNNLLLGVEVAYNEVDLEHDNPRQLTGWGYYSNTVSHERTFAAVSKFGFVHQKALFYGLAGITSGKFTTNLWSGLDPIEGSGSETSENKTAYTIGGGIEQLISKNIAVRAEYSFSDYGSISSETTGGFGPYRYTFDNKVSSYRLGVSYRF